MREIWILEWAKWRWKELYPEHEIWKWEQETPWADDCRYLLALNDNYRGIENIPFVEICYGVKENLYVCLNVRFKIPGNS